MKTLSCRCLSCLYLVLAGLVGHGYGQSPGTGCVPAPCTPPIRLITGTVERYEAFPSRWVDARNVDVWLPEGYGRGGEKYDVVYMHDGQMLFDPAVTWNRQSWGADETLGKLVASGQIRPCILVGIWNNGVYRHAEFMPRKAMDYMTGEERRKILEYATPEKGLLYRGELRADHYLRFLVTELKPLIDRNYRTRSSPRHTFIAGSSMGGMISLYAICEYPKVFGGAACLSTHWTGTYYTVGNPVPGAMAAYLRDHLPSPVRHRIYFDFGTKTLDTLYRPFQAAVDRVMQEQGYNRRNWITREFPGDDHSENAWKRRFEIPVRFLLGTRER